MNTVTSIRALSFSREMVARPLDGRVAVVTGSTRGTGLAIAAALAAAGATIVLHGCGEDAEIDNLVHVLGARHDVAVRHEDADMSDPDAVAAMLNRAARSFGPIDVLVNNACMQHVAPIESFPVTKWDAIIATNLSAVFHATRAVLPDMKRRGWGRIVNVASAHGSIGSAFKGAYVAARHGIIGLTKVTALESAESGVTCNAICPGQVWSRRTDIDAEAMAGQQDMRGQASQKLTTVSDVAGAVAFLCGPSAAAITGTAMALDGGWGAP